jgi:hypothetical protein
LQPFRKNIWLIYFAFFALGLIYLVVSSSSRWEALKTDAVVDLAYLNRILSSSITLNFDQQEIMLELLGRQLLTDGSTLDTQQTRKLLDDILLRTTRFWPLGWPMWMAILQSEAQISISTKCPI